MKLQDSDSKNKYDGLSDGELIEMLRDGEKGIADYLCEKYKPLVKKKAGSMFIIGGDSDDLIQEGMIGLFKAIRDYDFGRDASFSTFAELCVSRQIYTAVRNSGRKKYMPLNTSVSLNATEETSDDFKDRTLEEQLASKDSNPEAMLIDKENTEEIEKFIETELSSFEREVLELYLTGMGYVDIAKVLSKDEKSTDNALSRAKSKLKKRFNP